MHRDPRLRHLTAALILAASATACQGKALPEKVTDTAEAMPPVTAPLTEAQKKQAQASAMDLTRMQLIDDRCHWLDKTGRAAVDATAAERQAWLTENGLVTPEADMAANVTLAGNVDCSNQRDAIGVRFGAWQMRSTWALRAQALLDGAERPDWFARQSPALPYRLALDETLAAMNQLYADSMEEGRPAILAEATRMLALVCPNAPHQCPVDAADNAPKRSKAYAQVWVQQATKFAEVLAQDPVKLPPVPQIPQ